LKALIERGDKLKATNPDMLPPDQMTEKINYIIKHMNYGIFQVFIDHTGNSERTTFALKCITIFRNFKKCWPEVPLAQFDDQIKGLLYKDNASSNEQNSKNLFSIFVLNLRNIIVMYN
jgi:hypothetical protein